MRTTVILLSTLLFSCSLFSKKKYVYVEGTKQEVIEAENDSVAYALAYRKFQISKQVHENTTKALGDFGLSAPSDFKLLDNTGKEVYAVVDETKITAHIKELADQQGEHLRQTVNKARFKDTIGSNDFPVKIIKARFSTQEYSNYKNVSLSFKNISGKKIDAIRFRWYGENSFNEPADMLSSIDGWGGGFDDSGLGIGKTGYGTWSMLSKDGKKIIVAFPTEVAFSDGSKWKNPN